MVVCLIRFEWVLVDVVIRIVLIFGLVRIVFVLCILYLYLLVNFWVVLVNLFEIVINVLLGFVVIVVVCILVI